MPDNIKAWIFGVGPIGQEYAKILDHLGISFQAVGRSTESVKAFEEATGHKAIVGGAAEFLKKATYKPEFAIVAVTANQISPVAIDLLNYGLDKILLEKPGGMVHSDLEQMRKAAGKANIYIAYNRRFLSSVKKAQEIIKEDGGVRSFHFDFTEWPSRILSFEHPEGALENWFYLNSTHVVDMAFFLGGWPKIITCEQSGKLDWHTPAIFAGAGISNRDAVFSYKADWGSSGRWMIEIMTPKRKLIFAPLEQLKEQRLNEIPIHDIIIDDADDKSFKPGFLTQTKAFLKGDKDLLTLEEQLLHWAIFDQMAGRR